MWEDEKRSIFEAVFELANSGGESIGMVEMATAAQIKMRSDAVRSMRFHDRFDFRRNIADLILIGISKNNLHVKAIVENSKKKKASLPGSAHSNETCPA